ncbi:DUF1850 domain-containing protein [Terribacillus sp. 179-K 1B1 HS]|uniref:DUF1850 domain-containing protein n=1 Tax=Terribacillus sp. 179-K 1B1 HS TaxID=3142388 RepID=UPI00399FAAB0
MRIRIILLLISLMTMVLLVLYIFVPFRHIIACNDLQSDQLLAYLPVEDEAHVSIRYTHSIHRSDVTEEYTIKRTRLYPYQLVYEDTAVGMPADANPGETFEMKDGKYYIRNMKGYQEALNLTIGEVVANHQLVYQGHSYSLQENIGPGVSIRIQAEYTSLWNLWKGERLE